MQAIANSRLAQVRARECDAVKAMVLGAGQLGNALAHDSGDDVTVLDRAALELTDRDAITRALEAHRPDVVINATAYNRVDEAESHPELAFEINAIVPGRIARSAVSVGARVVHVSTDYVFSGATGRPYVEDNLPAPLNVYGASKLAGEHLVLMHAPNALVVRTSGVFGIPAPRAAPSSNFVLAILRQAERATDQRRPLRVVADQVVSPTYASDLAAAIMTLVRQNVSGTIHVTNSGSCSWHEFAETIVAAAGIDVRVLPIGSDEYACAARRPAYSVLSNSRLTTYGIVMPHWRDALGRYLASLGITPAVNAAE
jgi:dTDP-4-dehydrorhamnose reductase